MKSRLHEFSFKINNVINKNFFKNYKYVDNIIGEINIINEIKKDNGIINATSLNEFEIYLLKYDFYYFKREYLNIYYIEVNTKYYKFDFNIDYNETYK